MNSVEEKANSVVKNHVLWSMGAGLIPIPVIDFVAVTGVQLDMLRNLSRLYGHDFSESSAKSWISALSGTYLARLGAQAVKAIPGIGSIIGGVSMSVLSGASTYAVGKVFVRHFETGGNFFDFDPQKFKDFYKEQFERGKNVAKDMKKESDKKEEKDPFDRLKELRELRDAGLIDEEEFMKMKNKIMDEI